MSRLAVPSVLLLVLAVASAADPPTAREVMSHGYPKAIELTLGPARAVLCL